MYKECLKCKNMFKKTYENTKYWNRKKYCCRACASDTWIKRGEPLPENWVMKMRGRASSKKGKHSNYCGEKHHNWRGGKTKDSHKIRNSIEYKLWRESVFKRDDYTCIFCLKRGGDLNADHIKPFSLFPELRFAIDNGRTLCVDCHKKTDSYMNRWIKVDDYII